MDLKFFTTAYGILPLTEQSKIEVVENRPINTWLNDGSFVYRVQLSGGYRKGLPCISNDYMFSVNGVNGMTTAEQANNMGAHIADILRQDQFKQTLCNLQAYRREFYLRHSVTGLFYSRKHGWRSWEKDKDDPCVFTTTCAIEVIRTLEDIQHVELIDRGLIEIHMTDIPEEVINPVNVEGKPFVVLKSLSSRDVCITGCKKDQNVAILANGRLAYDVVAFCDSYEDAQPIWEKALYK